MSLQIKTILLILLFLALAAAIIYVLATWAGIEATKADDYQIVIRLTEPMEVGR